MAGEHAVISIGDTDPTISVDAGKVVCGFCLCPMQAYAKVNSDEFMHNAQTKLQPQFWRAVRSRNPGIKLYLMATSAPEGDDVLSALKEKGLFHGHSIVIGVLSGSLDGGRTTSDFYVGFVWLDPTPRIIFSRDDAVLPK